jgi:uncharacterized protein YlbG (UPF0298 family)
MRSDVKILFNDMDAVEAGFAFWAMCVDTHALHAKVSRCQKFSFVAAVKTVLAKTLGQPYL